MSSRREVRIGRLVLKGTGHLPAARFAEALERELARRLGEAALADDAPDDATGRPPEHDTGLPAGRIAGDAADRIVRQVAPKLGGQR